MQVIVGSALMIPSGKASPEEAVLVTAERRGSLSKGTALRNTKGAQGLQVESEGAHSPCLTLDSEGTCGPSDLQRTDTGHFQR